MTGLCEPYELAKEMGVDLQPTPTHERVPSFTLGVANVNPLEMAEAYATFAARGSTATPGRSPQIHDSDGNLLKDYPAVQAGDAQRGRRRRQRHPQGRHGARRLRPVHLDLDKQSAGKTGTIEDNKAVWFVGYTPNLATAAMIAGANQSGQPITLDGQMVGGTTSTSRPAPPRRPDVGRGDAGRSRQWLPDATFTPPTRRRSRAQLPVPASAGCRPDGRRDAARGRVHRGRGLRRLERTPRAPSPTPPRPRHRVPRAHGHDLPSTGTPPPPRGGARWRRWQRRRSTAAATAAAATATAAAGAEPHPELAAYLGGHGAAVGAALVLRRDARPSPCPSPACPRPRRRSAAIGRGDQLGRSPRRRAARAGSRRSPRPRPAPCRPARRGRRRRTPSAASRRFFASVASTPMTSSSVSSRASLPATSALVIASAPSAASRSAARRAP